MSAPGGDRDDPVRVCARAQATNLASGRDIDDGYIVQSTVGDICPAAIVREGHMMRSLPDADARQLTSRRRVYDTDVLGAVIGDPHLFPIRGEGNMMRLAACNPNGLQPGRPFLDKVHVLTSPVRHPKRALLTGQSEVVGHPRWARAGYHVRARPGRQFKAA